MCCLVQDGRTQEERMGESRWGSSVALVDGVASNDEEWGRKKLVLGGLGGGEQTVSGLSREGSSGDVEYFTGVWALYVGTEGTTHTVQIISVDCSLAPSSFLILLPDGTETTTEAANFQGVTEQPSPELVAGDVGLKHYC